MEVRWGKNEIRVTSSDMATESADEHKSASYYWGKGQSCVEGHQKPQLSTSPQEAVFQCPEKEKSSSSSRVMSLIRAGSKIPRGDGFLKQKFF